MFINQIKNLSELKKYELPNGGWSIKWARTRKECIDRYGAGAKIVKVDSGWHIFDSIADYDHWNNQK